MADVDVPVAAGRAGQEQNKPTRRGEAIARQTPCRPGQSCCSPHSVGKPRHVEGSQGMSDAAAQARIGAAGYTGSDLRELDTEM